MGIEDSARSFDELWQLRDVLRSGGPGVGLPLALVDGLRTLLRCDVVAFNELDSVRRSHHFMQAADTDGADEVSVPDPAETGEEVFWEHYWHSECSVPDTSGDRTGILLQSDFLSQRQLHSSPLYTDDPAAAAEYELMAFWPGAGPGRTLRLLCVRDDRDFDDDDRFLLELLSPHLYRAYLRCETERQDPSDRSVRGLTARERAVLGLAGQGATNRAIGHRLGISEGTVRTHLQNIYAKLDVSSRTAAAMALTGASSPSVTEIALVSE